MIRYKPIWLLAGLLCLALTIAAVILLRDDPWKRHMVAGAAAYQQGKYAEAAKQIRAAVEEAREFGPADRRLAASLNNLAAIFDAQGKYAEAEPLHQRALAIREKALGSEHPDVAQSLNNLAEVYGVQARYAAATVRLSFWKCARAGQCRKTTLIEKYGADVRLPDLLHMIVTDCPKIG